MISTSETGHTKNLANFEILISRCIGYEEKYQPSKQALAITSLQTLLEKGKADMATLRDKKNALDIAINNRQIAFSGLKSLATKIINALKATDASGEVLADAISINTKIQGKRAKTIDETQEQEPRKTISVSQQSFDNMLENFSRLVNLISQEQHYAPNEEQLKIETLVNYQNELHTQNTEVINAQVEYNNARIARNHTLYGDNTGIIDTAAEVKGYILSVFGANTPEYRQVRKIAFRKQPV